MTTLGAAFRLLAFPLYVPMLSLFFAWGLVTPVLPLFAQSFGASVQEIGVITSCRAFGSLVGTLPAGKAVQHHGVRSAVLYGAVAYVLACAWGGLSSGVLSLGLSRCLAGAAYSLFSIGQQTFVRLSVPKEFRGRVLATVGGSYRVGGFTAPLFGGSIAQEVGFRSVFLLQTVISAFSLPFIVKCMPDTRPAPKPAPSTSASADSISIPELTLREFIATRWHTVASAWIATLLLSLVRSVRDLLLPLAAAQVGLSRRGTGNLMAASYGADVLLFPLGGWVADVIGLWAGGLSSCGVMALGFGMLAHTLRAGGSSDSVGALYGAAVVQGAGNGLSSGIVMALASNGAPESAAAGPYIAFFQFLTSISGVLGPLALGRLADARGLGAGATAACVAAAVGSVWWAVALPRGRPGTGEREGAAAAVAGGKEGERRGLLEEVELTEVKTGGER